MRICTTARTQVLGGYFFHPWAGIKVELKFDGLRIIHIGPTIAKKSVENWFPIEMINLKTPAETPVRAEKFQGIKDDSMWT